MKITLPIEDGQLAPYTLRGPGAFTPATAGTPLTRVAYSAVHVVADARAAIDPWLQCAVDWDATIGYRRHLWSLGLGVAESMDTAQRGMGLDWPTSLELIRRSLDAAKDFSAKGVQLVEVALQSWKERRWVDVPTLQV